MALDLMMQDLEYDKLLMFGLEGVSYKITDQGKVALPDGVTAETNPYNWDGNGFWFINKDIVPARSTWSDAYIAMVKDLRDNVLIPDPCAGFTVATDNIKTEVANCQNVYHARLNQAPLRLNPLAIGAVKDVEAAFDNMIGKLKDAGQQKLVDEAATQLKTWKEANGK